MKTVRDHVNDEFNKTGRYYNEMPYFKYKKNLAGHKAYSDRQNEIEDNFKSDLEKEFGTDILPKSIRDKIFSKAWEDGHAYGHSEVLIHYEDIADFVDDIISAILNQVVE
jgi:hypothetical protein